MKRSIVTVLLCALFCSAFAQDDTTSKFTVAADTSTPAKTAVPKKSYFSATVSFLSNSVYNGRKDSVATPYLTPMLGYYDKSGFFIDASWSLKRPRQRL